MSRFALAALAATLLMTAGATQAQTPPPGHPPNVSARRHPNMAAAQRLMQRADLRITDAQRANEWDLDGHAARARQLLEQAIGEMKASAIAANHNHR